MFIVVFNDVGDICMTNSIFRKHKHCDVIQKHALTIGKKAMWKVVFKHFSVLCKLYIKKDAKSKIS